MKAKLRRLQKEKLKQSQSNITNSLNESQNKKQTENKNNQIISSDNNNIKNTYSVIKKRIKSRTKCPRRKTRNNTRRI